MLAELILLTMMFQQQAQSPMSLTVMCKHAVDLQWTASTSTGYGLQSVSWHDDGRTVRSDSNQNN
jgi:hypothetical protein